MKNHNENKFTIKTIFRFCLMLTGILVWNTSFGQNWWDNRDTPDERNSSNSEKAVSIISNNDNYGSNEYIYLRSGENDDNRWFTDAQFIVADNWIGTRKPLLFFVENNSWKGFGEYIQNTKIAGGDFGLSFYSSATEIMSVSYDRVGVRKPLTFFVGESRHDGIGEYINNTKNSGDDFGLSFFVGSEENLTIKKGSAKVKNLTVNWGTASDKARVSINTDNKVPNTVLTVAGATYIGPSADKSNAGNKRNRFNKDYLAHYNLWVDSGIVSEDIVLVNSTEWGDKVFEEDYVLPNLLEVEKFLKKHKHMEGIPSEKEVEKEGYNVHDFNMGLLKNVEELLLYTIEQHKEIQKLKDSQLMLLKKIKRLENQQKF